MSLRANRQRRHRREKRRSQRAIRRDKVREWIDQAPEVPLEVILERAHSIHMRAFEAELERDISALEQIR